ncbi:hypothetical protein J7W08_09270 [Methanococcoides orientis]|uniref:hypothetical protein n=1 Tax=Methanococcoides orientis TaxID=2822137 RepID=UPI001E622BD8|nr:hypothetical protein [Methanococcoides orientis]UGV40264.1 hypothetical protein J7W08_09270 [Methanococcoides orientis]
MRKTLAAVLVVVSLCSIVILAVGVDHGENGGMSADISYTDEELDELYSEFNVTENDIKFAKGELPHYLEGTVLNSDVRLLVTEDGESPEGMVEGVDYEMVISEEEMIVIEADARQRYLEIYGVDVSNPKLDEVYGYMLPVGEVKRLIISNPSLAFDY